MNSNNQTAQDYSSFTNRSNWKGSFAYLQILDIVFNNFNMTQFYTPYT